jgi:hypothetical protein
MLGEGKSEEFGKLSFESKLRMFEAKLVLPAKAVLVVKSTPGFGGPARWRSFLFAKVSPGDRQAGGLSLFGWQRRIFNFNSSWHIQPVGKSCFLSVAKGYIVCHNFFKLVVVLVSGLESCVR